MNNTYDNYNQNYILKFNVHVSVFMVSVGVHVFHGKMPNKKLE